MKEKSRFRLIRELGHGGNGSFWEFETRVKFKRIEEYLFADNYICESFYSETFKRIDSRSSD